MKKSLFLFFSLVSIACAQLAIPWGDVDKTGSSLLDFTTRSAGDLNSGTLGVARLPAFTGGDATTSAGSGAITLGAVNSNVGTFGNATQFGNFTVDAKGRITAAGNTTVTPAWTSITSKPTTVAGYAITDAYTISQTDALRNGHSVRGGLAFDGTGGANQTAITTFKSISFFFKATADSDILSLKAWSTGAFRVKVTSGNLTVETNSPYQFLSTPITLNRIHHCVIVGVSGSPIKVYLNGALMLTGSGNLPSDLAGVSLGIGYDHTGAPSFVGNIYTVTPFNIGLTASEVLEVYENGGAPPKRYDAGSLTAIYTSDFSSGADSWVGGAATVTGNVDSINGVNDTLRVYADATTGVHYVNRAVTSARARAYRVTGQIYVPTGQTHITSADIKYGGQASGGRWTLLSGTYQFAPNAAWQTVDFTLLVNSTDDSSFYIIFAPASFAGSNSTTDDVCYVKGLTFTPAGAIAHYDADSDGVGFQLHDQTANQLDATVTTAGASWTNQKTSGYIRSSLTWAGTHEAKSLLGQRCLPDGAVVTHATVRSTTASSGSGLVLSNNSTSGYFVALQSFTTAKKLLTVANSGIPASSSDNDNMINLDPDNANFTGTIQVGVRYSTMPGTP